MSTEVLTVDTILEPGVLYSFYGVDNRYFKLGSIVFEALEDEDDGYRSYLESIPVVYNKGIFHNKPIVNVYYEEDDEHSYFKDETGHIWLEIGTDNTEDYYPCFVFNYSPRTNVTEYAEPIHNLDPKSIHAEKFI